MSLWTKRTSQVSNDHRSPDFVKPGDQKAIERGCKCKPQHGKIYRDGTGYDINQDCPLHSNWPELAE